MMSRKFHSARRLHAAVVLLAAMCLALAAAPLGAQGVVTELRLRTDPEEARVRPHEAIVVQALVYSEAGAGDEARKVRIQKNGIQFALAGEDSGWLSKPFRFQGQEPEPFHEPEEQGLASIIFRRARSQYVLQDAVLYTAPERPGAYEVRSEIDGKTAFLAIQVDPEAPSLRPAETIEFGVAPASADPYRRLAEHYAPFIAQETWFHPKSDYLARFDLDGDWYGDNNWANADEGSSQAFVHYAVIETRTHWFLTYNLFHPRDYSDKCVVGTCHENDNEGLILTIEKNGSEFGRLQTMETLAHNNIYSYRIDTRVRGNLHSFDGDVEFWQQSHPVIFVESGGHGIFGSLDSHSTYLFRQDQFSGTTGVTYVYKGAAERPRHANDRLVGYDLVPVYDAWWLRAHENPEGRGTTFDDYFIYQPFGAGRPRPPYPEIAGAFLGRYHSSNKAKPFWGWHDNRSRKKDAVANGQWGLDPAYAASQNLSFPEPFSLDYVFNPYLGVGRAVEVSFAPPRPAGTGTASAPPERSPSERLPLASIVPRRANHFAPDAESGQFDIRLDVDHEVLVYVRGGEIRYEVTAGQPPRDDGSEYTQALPRARFAKFSLEQKDGRGAITLVEPPTPGNDFTAKLRIEDPKSGGDRYHARLTWEAAEPYEEPAAQQAAPESTGVSGILSKHLGVLLPEAEPARQTQAPPSDLPGTELFSGDNDSSRYDSSSQGLFEFRGRVDGTALFYIRGERVFARVVSGRPVEVERFSFTQPLPAQRVSSVTIEKRDGRGEIVLLARPWEENQFTAVIEVTDEQGGDDHYHFRLSWKQ